MDHYHHAALQYLTSFQKFAGEAASRGAEWAALQRSYGLPDEFMWSAGLGLVVAIMILLYGNKQLSPDETKARLRAIEEQDKPTTGRSKTVQAPKDQKEKSDSKDELKVESKAQDPSMEEIITPDMDVEEMVRKTEKMAKKLGATEKDVREAIEKVRDQQRRGLSAMEIEMEEPFMRSVVRGLEWVMYMLCIFGAFYSLNLITQGDVGRVLCGMLPTEMELIGATDYLNSFGTPGALDKST